MCSKWLENHVVELKGSCNPISSQLLPINSSRAVKSAGAFPDPKVHKSRHTIKVTKQHNFHFVAHYSSKMFLSKCQKENKPIKDGGEAKAPLWLNWLSVTY